MKLNHTVHEVYKCARVAGHTKKFVFQWFSSCYRPFVFHLCKLLFNFSCLQYTQFEFVCYINVLCCICKIYLYSNVWFQCKTSECLVSFKFLSMSCMGIFSVTISLQKAVIIKQKYLLGYLFGFFWPLCYFFKGSELYFFTYLFFITVLLVYKIKNNDDFVIF